MKISIITPSFNSGKYIERAINSVVEQNYFDYEHIIVDGGSLDSTQIIVSQYDNILWISEPDEGQSDAMNKGFKLATGDIIVYLNADDYFLPNAFNSIIPHFEDGHKVVMGNIILKNELDGTERVVYPKFTLHEMLRHWERDAFCFNPVGYFYSKEVQELIPFNRENHYSMDLEFLLNVSLKFKIHKIDNTLGVFILSQNCKTGSNICKSDTWMPEKWSYIQSLAEQNLKYDDYLEFIKMRDIAYANQRNKLLNS